MVLPRKGALVNFFSWRSLLLGCPFVCRSVVSLEKETETLTVERLEELIGGRVLERRLEEGAWRSLLPLKLEME